MQHYVPLFCRFEIFQKPILLQPGKVEVVVLTTLYLHNFLMRNTPEKTGSARPNQMPPKEPGVFMEIQRGTGAVTQGGNPAQHRQVREMR